MSADTAPVASRKIGPAEGFVLGVLGVMGGLVIAAALVLSVVAIAVGDGQIALFTK